MKYICIQARPKDLEKKLAQYGADGWRVVAQSESTWVIKQCLGLSNTVDSIINVTLEKE